MSSYYILEHPALLRAPKGISKVRQARCLSHYSKGEWECHFIVEIDKNMEHYPPIPC